MHKIIVKYYVDPDELKNNVIVEDPVKIVFININNSLVQSILGETGLKIAKAGLSFYFDRVMAEELIAANAAKRVT